MKQSKSRYMTVFGAGVQVLAVGVFKKGQNHQTDRGGQKKKIEV